MKGTLESFLDTAPLELPIDKTGSLTKDDFEDASERPIDEDVADSDQ